jgi:hypothetical protein
MAERVELTPEIIPAMQSAAIQKLNKSSAGSLLLWGLINLVVGGIFAIGNGKVIAQVSDPGFSLYFVCFSGLILGGMLLMMALVGVLSRNGLAIFLDGVGLMIIGLWNIVYLFITPIILEPYGLEVTGGIGGGPLWIMLGFSQVIWAVRSWRTFFNSQKWSDLPHGQDTSIALGRLDRLLYLSASREDGVIKGSIERKGFMGFGSQTVRYVGILQKGMFYLFSSDLRTILCTDVFDFRAHSSMDTTNLHLTYSKGGRNEMVVLEPCSAVIFMEMTGRKMTPDIMARIVKSKDGAVSIVQPYLKDPDPNVRYQAVKVLGFSNENIVPELLWNVLREDNGLPRAAVIDIYTQKGYDINPKLMEDLLAENDSSTFNSLLAYIRKHPKQEYQASLEKYMAVVTDASISRDIGKLVKLCAKA